MDQKVKAEILDAIISTRFRGNKSYTWDEFHIESWYKDFDPDFFVVENMLYKLMSDGIITDSLFASSISRKYHLTPKGMAMLGDWEHESYSAKYQRELNAEKDVKDTMHYAQWGMWIGIIALGVSILLFIVDYFNKN